MKVSDVYDDCGGLPDPRDEAMMTDDEISEFIADYGQPSETFLYLTPPQPASEAVAEAIAALEALNVIKTGPWCGGYISRKAALRALKGEE